VLVIHHVTSWELKDEQHVVWYDFNRLRYRASAGRLEVLTNVPLLLRAEVTAQRLRFSRPESLGNRNRASRSEPGLFTSFMSFRSTQARSTA
jgi:hypothetical protein